jgi:deoxyuridine 5'-triphosphate nucleotidohydrolase
MFEDTYFDDINEPIKAYMLGIIAYNMKINDSDKIIVELNIENSNINKINNEFNKFGTCTYIDTYTMSTSITSETILNKIRKYIDTTSICDSKISDILDVFTDKMLKHEFVKAYIERFGNIITKNNESNLYITYYNEENSNIINNMFNIPYTIRKNFNLTETIYNDVNIIDLFGIIYKNGIYHNNDLYNWYYNIIKNIDSNYNTIKVFKTDDNAVIPSKNRISDAGYDITIIKEAKKFNEKTTLYDTGIKLNIPNGYYVEIVPRSSISKSGYMLANSIGIIDQSYRGNIFVALTKINESSDDIKLPFCCCQMIVRKQIYSDIEESFKDFNITNRNEGGYGDGSLKKV